MTDLTDSRGSSSHTPFKLISKGSEKQTTLENITTTSEFAYSKNTPIKNNILSQEDVYTIKFNNSPDHRQKGSPRKNDGREGFFTNRQFGSIESIPKPQISIQKRPQINVLSNHLLSQKEFEAMQTRINKLCSDNAKLFSDNKRLIEDNHKLAEEKKSLVEAKNRLASELTQCLDELSSWKNDTNILESYKMEINRLSNQLTLQKQLYAFQIKRLNADIQILTSFRDKEKASYFTILKEKQHIATMLSVQKTEKQLLHRQLDELKKTMQKKNEQTADHKYMANQRSVIQISSENESNKQSLLEQLKLLRLENINLKEQLNKKEQKQSNMQRNLKNIKIISESEIQALKNILQEKEILIKELYEKLI